jgi:hypothetical protein
MHTDIPVTITNSLIVQGKNPIVLVGQMVRDQEVGGSNPLSPTKEINKL